jgi:dipeptidyl aminopeptidase/acylaminoacyl peptidase
MRCVTVRLWAFIVVFSVICFPLWALANTPSPLTPEDVAKIQWVTEVALSPDGKLAAFGVSVPRELDAEKDGPPSVELRVLNLATRESRAWVAGELVATQLRFSPDGRRITFLAKRAGDEAPALWAIPISGGEAVRLARAAHGIDAYDWSPDSARVAFVAQVPDPPELKKSRDRGFDQEVYEEDWRHLAVYVASVPPTLDAPAGEPRRLPDFGAEPQSVLFSPDGAQLAVDASPRPLVDDRYMLRRLYVLDSQSGATVAKVENPGKLGDFAWTADGKRLVLSGGASEHDPAPNRLLLAEPSGGAPQHLLATLEADVMKVEALEGGKLLLLIHRGVGSELAVYDPRTQKLDVYFASEQHNVVSFDVDQAQEKVALVVATPSHPWELYTWKLERGAQPQRVHDANPWLAQRRLATQEVVRWTARDGLQLEGVLVRAFAGAGPAPLIVYVHGGPEAHEVNGWLTGYARPGHVAAARGFSVFYPNYRGSTGRGLAFAQSSQGDAGGREFDDILDGIDHLVASGAASADRVGITGGSYGGYLSAWAATKHSKRFRAAVMAVGIGNQLSKVGSTDIPNEIELVHFLKSPHDDPQFFLERSPISYAKGASTPLLIMHGKRDERVDPAQAKETYRALERVGKAPVRLVIYPRDGHGNRNRSSRYDYNLRMLQWFEHFLQGNGVELPPLDPGRAPLPSGG